MGTNECSQSASKSSWDSQDFGDVRMVHFCKSSRPQWVNWIQIIFLAGENRDFGPIFVLPFFHAFQNLDLL